MPFLLQPGLAYRPAPGVNASEHLRTLRVYLWNKSAGLCALCSQPVDVDDVHADHIIPRSKGGADGVYNLQASHQRCNARKGDRTTAATEERQPEPNTTRDGRATKFFEVSDVATVLSVSKRDVIGWLERKEMTGVFLGDKVGWRIEREDLERFLDSRRGD